MDSLPASDPLPMRDLFHLVYGELRRLAAHQLAAERVGHTLNPTALVHEAYLSLTRNINDGEQAWGTRKQFFLAAAEAMRHILVDYARYHRRQKRGGDRQREDIPVDELPAPDQSDVVSINDALEALAAERADLADLVKLRYFAGMTLDEAAEILELAPSTADRRWAFAKAWLLDRLTNEEANDS